MPTRKPLSAPWIAAAVLLVLIGGYVLSIGPVYRWHVHNGTHAKELESVYAPIWWLCTRSFTALEIVNAYIRWWLQK